jgi:NAD(P)H-dependent FMN reductase
VTFVPRVLAFAGSLRRESYNKKLVRSAAGGAIAAGAEVTFLDLRDLPLPLYDEDLEHESGLPQNALELKRLMKEHHGFLIAAPEYNGSITAALKNAIDWASRRAPGEVSRTCFDGKIAAVMSASPGAFGGSRGLIHVRAILGGVRILVLPDQVSLARAGEAFDDAGSLKDAAQKAQAEALGRRLVEVVTRLSS